MRDDSLNRRWTQADAIFTASLDQPPEERRRFVREQCGDDIELANLVLDLVRHDESASAEAFLERTDPFIEAGVLRHMLADDEAALEGSRIGAYRLLREVGRGGTGTVFMAQRDDDLFEHRVAVKLLRRGLDTDDVLERFRAERRILASLNHPNIARLFDGGSMDDGRPYLVMELVEGEPLTDYCIRHQLSVEARLQLFLVVARAVDHAHRNLVVHRDIKPSNILVTEDGVVKLLDFGIAKLLDVDADASGPHSRTGCRLLTPEYASPEQVRGEAITTATDVYQLGVLLYELLCGRKPYGVGANGVAATERAILEQEPLAPSRAVIESAGAAGASAARSWRARQRQLSSRLRGDLDVIILTALRKDPTRRYASADALIQDLVRHLGGLPVSARADTWAYRARKLVKRRPGAVAAGAIALLASFLYVGTLQSHAVRLERERNIANAERESARVARNVAETQQHRAESELQRAEAERERAGVATLVAEREMLRAAAERDRAEYALHTATLESAKAAQVSAFLARLFQSSDPVNARGASVTVREVLDRALENTASLPDEPAVRAELLSVLGGVYASIGETDAAIPLLREAVTARRQAHGELSAAVVSDLKTLDLALFRAGQLQQSEQVVREALALHRRLPGALERDEAMLLADLSRTLQQMGSIEAASVATNQAAEILSRHRSTAAGDYAAALRIRGNLLWRQQDYHGALAAHREELEVRRAADADHPDVGGALHLIGTQQINLGELDGAIEAFREAIALYERVYGPGHGSTFPTMNNLAIALIGREDFVAAERVLEALLESESQAPEHPRRAAVLGNLGRAALGRGDHDAAERHFMESMAVYRRVGGDDHPSLGYVLHDLGRIETARGRYDAAIALHRDGLDRQRSAFTDRRAQVRGLNLLAEALRRHGDLGEGEHLAREALEISGGDQAVNQNVALSLATLAAIRMDAGDTEGAAALARTSLETYRKLLPETHPTVVEARERLDEFLRTRAAQQASAASRP